MAREYKAALLAAAIVAAAALVGCESDGDDNGVAELSAGEILQRAEDAARAASSVRVVGDIADEGTEVSLDMTYQGSEGAKGTLTAEGLTFELLRIADDYYLKADAQTWSGLTNEPAAGELLADRYVLFPPDDEKLADMASFLDWEDFIDSILEPDGTITKGETREDVNGTPAVGLTSEGSEGDGILWVATEGEPYPLRIEPSEGSSGEGAIDFLDWGKEFEITAPPADDVVDLSELGGSSS